MGIGGLALAWAAVAVILQARDPLSANVFPGPLQVLRTAVALSADGSLGHHAWASFRRVLLGYGLAVAVGVPMAWVAGASPALARQVQPILALLRPIPPFAWIPISLLALGIGDASAVAIVFLGAFFPIVLNTFEGLYRVDPAWLLAARNLGASPAQVVLSVRLPASLPRMLEGLRLAWTLSWMVVVVAELVGSDRGLGFLIMDSRNLGQPAMAVVGMTCIGAIAAGSEVAMLRLERRVLRWQP